ncbi:hypothetical protein ACFO3J_27380 [Streptomyces polygonati]|uniref:Uncharacterized protein n=1 Tax=Streptomyces polygonati TaxID=1617087 RepID=A0ABV8HT94_9ACTN
MSVWNMTGADRVASLRESAEADSDPAGQLSDLDLLNAAYESVLREQIDTRDRYMGLTTSLRKHDEAVRAAAVHTFKGDADRYAQYAVARHMKPFDALLYRAANLPDRPGPRQIEGLHAAAERVRLELEDAGPTGDLIDPGGARHTLRTLRHAVGILAGKDGLDASDVLRLVTSALDNEPLTDIFTVADQGTPRPVPPPPGPAFAGPGWSEARGLWTYQPDDTGAHIKAYPLGEDWYLDLWSARGQLLAFGTVPEAEVATLAPALTARAGTWSNDRSDYAWRRFADTAQATRTAAAPPNRAPAPAAQRSEDARVRAATAASPSRSAAQPAAAAKPPASPPPALPAAHATPARHR